MSSQNKYEVEDCSWRHLEHSIKTSFRLFGVFVFLAATFLLVLFDSIV